MRKVLCFFIAILLLLAGAFPAAKTKAEEEKRLLPIIMYHSISTTKKGVYSLSPTALREDLRALKRLGYTSVTLREIKGYLKGLSDLPEKPVFLTFDDGHYDNMYYAADILEEEGFTALLSVIGCFTEYSSTHEKDHVEYSHLTWEEIGTLSRRGVFEIGSHSYAMHAYRPRFGVKRKKGETEEEHRLALEADLDLLERSLIEKSGVIPLSFAYPFGAYDETSEEVVKSRYEAIFTCYERINVLEKGDKKKLSRLWRINRDGTLDTNSFLCKHRLNG